MSDVADGPRMIVSRPSNQGMEHETPIDDDTQLLRVLSHWKIQTGDDY